MCEGVRVGALELSEVLGTGANANVRLGVDKSTNMRYAVKVYEKYRLIEPRKMKSVKR
jgi:serine/threonine protein kinase